ncbi:MAG: universal stress protein, partial [Proteobacteria bacterium]|nr:universal stress protein [Pseudomonadota bacterium]
VVEALNSSLLETGSRVAARENAALHVLHVLQHPLEDEKSVLKEEYRLIDRTLREHAASSMDKMLDQHKAREEDRHRMVPLDQHLVKGTPHKVIARFVKQNDIDLLVMGSVARSGIPGFFVGNTAEKILDNVDCSVLVLKPEGWTAPVS